MNSEAVSRTQDTVTTAGQAAATDDDVVAKPLRHPGRWVSAAVLLVLLSALFSSLWGNPNIDHPSVAEFVFDERVLSGVVLTIVLTALSMAMATVLGILLAVMRLSTNPVLRVLSWSYVWFFRGTPLLVQVVFWGYLGLLYTELSLGIPFTSIEFVSADTNVIVTAFVAGLLALGLNEAAYASEIIRAGLVSVDHGHVEAAYSLGMSPTYTLRRIVLPQAMRVIIPPMGNETISMLKNTALLQLIAVHELYTQATLISARNLRQVELLIVACIWYLVMTSALAIPQYYLERKFGRGTSRNLPPTPWQQARRMFESARAQVRKVARPDEGVKARP
jgi:polar amino acid transport system permease protein